MEYAPNFRETEKIYWLILSDEHSQNEKRTMSNHKRLKTDT